MANSTNVRELSVGLYPTTEWGIEGTPGTSDCLIKITKFSPPKGSRKSVTDEGVRGQDMESNATLLEYDTIDGSLGYVQPLEGNEDFFAMLFGIYTHTTPVSGVVKHLFKKAGVVSQRYKTLSWEEGNELKSVRSILGSGMTIDYQDGLNVDFKFKGDKIIVSGNSLSACTYKSSSEGSFSLLECKVYLNNETAGDFLPADQLTPNGINMSFDRGFESSRPGAGQDMASEPFEKGSPKDFLTLNFASKNTTNADYLADYYAKTYKKAKIVFSGPVIVDGYNYELAFHWPRLWINEAPEYGSETPLPTTIKFQALKAPQNPTGMIDRKPYITLQNRIPALTGYPSS